MRRLGHHRPNSFPPAFSETTIDADSKGDESIEVRREIPSCQLILDAVGEAMSECVEERRGILVALHRNGAKLDGVLRYGPSTLG